MACLMDSAAPARPLPRPQKQIYRDQFRSQALAEAIREEDATFSIVESHLWDVAHVGADRWQSPASPNAAPQPLVERSLYVTARGLTTSRIPYGGRSFELWFDFIQHELVLETSEGARKTLKLIPCSVADFYREFMQMLRSEQIEVKIWGTPVEVPNPIPFDQDRLHASYDSKSVEKFWRILLTVDSVLNKFRAGFIGKSSPVHFFWGALTLRLPDSPAAVRPNDPAPTL